MKIPKGSGQLTLVALFGEKQQTYPELWRLICDLQTAVANTLGPGMFTGYDERRVHATLIGLEGFRKGDDVWSAGGSDKNGPHRPMDIPGLVDYLLNDEDSLPIYIKVGGYKESTSYPFTSRGRHPYLRSFSIQGDTAVIMGWPVQNDLFTSALDNLRRSFNQFNVFHKYHTTEAAYDNDFFLVLGNVKKGLRPDAIDTCQNRAREIVSRRNIAPIKITKNQLSVIAYPDGDTGFEKAEAGSLDEARNQIDELVQLYSRRPPVGG